MADDKKQKRQASKGYALLKAPKNVSACSWNGEEFTVEDDGMVEVPAAAVPALLEHGFEAV